MCSLTKLLRWVGFVPAGLLIGLVATATAQAFLSPLCGYVWLVDAMALMLSGLAQPVAGYHAGRAIAPSKGKASRDLMLFPYALLGCLSVFVVLAGLWEGRPVDPAAASESWARLAFWLGLALGCLSLLHPPTPLPAAARDEATNPFVSTFAWSPTNN